MAGGHGGSVAVYCPDLMEQSNRRDGGGSRSHGRVMEWIQDKNKDKEVSSESYKGVSFVPGPYMEFSQRYGNGRTDP